jgi:hypothetical protein
MLGKKRKLSGLTDKLFWRPAADRSWHCFKALPREDGGGYLSLCHRFSRKRSGGQAACRPPSLLRCAACDAAEMKRRGWEEGGEDSKNWKEGWTRG